MECGIFTERRNYLLYFYIILEAYFLYIMRDTHTWYSININSINHQFVEIKIFIVNTDAITL